MRIDHGHKFRELHFAVQNLKSLYLTKISFHFFEILLLIIPTTQFSVTQELTFSKSNLKTPLSVGFICM